jgi:PEP-CTERM motif
LRIYSRKLFTAGFEIQAPADLQFRDTPDRPKTRPFVTFSRNNSAMLNQALRSSIAAAALVLCGASAFAGPTALVANVGWIDDNLSTAGGATDGSPFTFTLLAGQTASFKVTDAFLTGDSFDLYVNGSATIDLSSSLFAGAANAIVGDANGEAAWTSGSFEKFAYAFSTPGAYSFEVRGDGVAGVPAGLYYRLDVTDATVPEPSSLALAALALAGLGATARRRFNA